MPMSHARHCLTPSSGPEGLWGSMARCPPLAHLHGHIGCFRCHFPCVVDEGTTSLWQHPDEADLPKPAGQSARDPPVAPLQGSPPRPEALGMGTGTALGARGGWGSSAWRHTHGLKELCSTFLLILGVMFPTQRG